MMDLAAYGVPPWRCFSMRDGGRPPPSRAPATASSVRCSDHAMNLDKVKVQSRVWDAPFWSRGRKASSSRRPSSCSSSAAQGTCRSASAPQPSSSSRSTSRASLTPAVRTTPGPTRTATSRHGSTVASLTGGAPRINHGGAIVGIGYETGTCPQSGEGSNNFVVGGSTPAQASPVTRTAAQDASTSTPQ